MLLKIIVGIVGAIAIFLHFWLGLTEDLKEKLDK